MTKLHATEQVLLSRGAPIGTPLSDQTGLSRFSSRATAPWNLTTYGGFLTLVALWALKLYTTWGAWGNLTIDSGHEMYVPLLLAEGKKLYRDVWFMYGPAAPYFTSYLYRLFGVNLNVLYWAGSLSALGSAIFLFLAGIRLSSWLIGWTAGAMLLMEAFEPSLFCFPLPYTSAAVYACLIGCLFLWLVISASTLTSWTWTFAAGMAAAVALLLKPEFGIACYGTLGLLIIVRSYSRRSWRLLARDIGLALPGVVICLIVIAWMISIGGVQFMTQENIVSWPTSYFMKTFGKFWLAKNGFTISLSAFHEALYRTVPLAVALFASGCALWWKRTDARSKILKTIVVILAILFLFRNVYPYIFSQQLESMLSTIFFPQDMVLYVIVAALVAWWYFWRDTSSVGARSPAVPLLLTYTSLLAFRILMNMVPGDYSIYYNGPVVLSFLLLLCLIIPRSGRSRRFVFLGELVICLGCLTPVVLHAEMFEAEARNFVPLTTERGTIRVSKQKAESYKAAIQFMKEKAALGKSVLSVPEDTSLYFLSGTYCPTRVYLFVPGVIAPGKMTEELFGEIERKPVSYLLWSNRTFSEFGVPVFGKDFDVEIGDYLKSHYRPVAPVTPNSGNYWDWTAVVWERRPDAASK